MASAPIRTWLTVVVALCGCERAKVDDAGARKDGPAAAAPAPQTLLPAGSPGCEVSEALPAPALHVVADAKHSCAWERGRGVWCWGENSTGELGDGTRQSRSTPAAARIRSDDLVQLELGYGPDGGYTCALSDEGTVQCWGANYAGYLGDGTNTSRELPAPVVELADVVEIASGSRHSCARRSNGSVKCWGFGEGCDLGDGGCFSAATPVDVVGVANAVQLAVGTQFSCVLTAEQTVVCWGGNSFGEAGVGNQIAVLRPTQVPGLHDVVRVASSGANPCAQTRDGRVYCWGHNLYGFLGAGVSDEVVATPIEIPGVPCGAILTPGGKCALTREGEAYCWGTWTGDGKMTVHAEGAAKVPLQDVVALAGFRALFALKGDGSFWAWGWNESGQLGDGSTENRWSPVQVSLPR